MDSQEELLGAEEGDEPQQPADAEQGQERDAEQPEGEVEAPEERIAKMRRNPQEPTKEEVERHRLTHVPYRSWCPECVRARAKATPHLIQKNPDEKNIPTFHIDYWFMRDKAGAELVPVATIRDDKSKTIKAHVVPGKGNIEGVADVIIQDIAKMGYQSDVILKCDQEAALIDLVETIARRRTCGTTQVETGKTRDSQSNGVVERAIQSVEGMVRTMKLALEKKIKTFIPATHALMTWIVEHAAETINRYQVGVDGRTAYERLKGKKYNGEVFEFGQMVFHRFPGVVKGGSMEPRWDHGIWLGKSPKSDEHLICMENGSLVKARSIIAKTPSESWSAEAVMKVKKNPTGVNFAPREPDQGRSIDEDIDAARRTFENHGPVVDEPEEMDKPPMDFYIRPEHLRAHGFSSKCPKCRAMRVGDNRLSRRGHTNECRSRIRKCLLEDEKMSKDVKEADQRKDEYLARRVEESDKQSEQNKKVRIAVEGDQEQERLSPNTGGASSSSDGNAMDTNENKKRSRDENDEEENARPTQFQTVEEQDEEELEDAAPFPGRSYFAMPGGRPVPVCPPRAEAEKMNGMQLGGFIKAHECESYRRVRPPSSSDRACEEEDIDNVALDYCKKVQKLEEEFRDLRMHNRRGGIHLNTIRKMEAKSRAGRYAVAEVFSPPRICARAAERGIAAGWSLDWRVQDPRTGRKWDLSREEERQKVLKMLKRDQPELVVCSPPCTLFSLLQQLVGDPAARKPEKWREACEMVNFCVEICKVQMRAGRKFLFEHPQGASSWEKTDLKELRSQTGVVEANAHMCAFGMESQDSEGRGLVKKPTRFLTNSMAIRDKLDQKCSKTHRHVQLLSGRAAAAAIYPQKLCDAVLDGLEIEVSHKFLNNLQGTKIPDGVEELHEPDHTGWEFIDDNSGKSLRSEEVRRARAEEMKTFKELGVYKYARREEVFENRAKIVGVRWVDIDKGSKVRSRLVAQEFAAGQDRDDLFAGTPPLMATKLLLSDLASQGDEKWHGKSRLLVMDVKKAFLYGDIEERLYIELPDEDPKKKAGYVGRLVKAMYGTRAAPQVWQRVVREFMYDLGFTGSLKYPCVFYHEGMELKVVTHVDDFLCVGPSASLEWLREQMEKKFAITSKMLGPKHESGTEQEVEFLGRSIRWCREGIEYEGDEKHAKTLVKDWGMDQSKSVGTPGTSEEKAKIENDEELPSLNGSEAKRYRAAAARLNYLAQDRPDLAFAAKEVSRAMSSPNSGDEMRLKRVIRYIQGCLRVCMQYKWQKQPEVLTVYSDSDWAGCVRSRKSTSGGCAMHGAHLIHHWSSTQATVALSVAEAELNGITKAAAESIGGRDLCNDLGMSRGAKVMTDSSSACGITSRQGCGKLKHLSTKQLWVQQVALDKAVAFQKIPRAVNPSDALTHHWTAPEGAIHFPFIGLAAPTPRQTSSLSAVRSEGGCLADVCMSADARIRGSVVSGAVRVSDRNRVRDRANFLCSVYSYTDQFVSTPVAQATISSEGCLERKCVLPPFMVAERGAHTTLLLC